MICSSNLNLQGQRSKHLLLRNESWAQVYYPTCRTTSNYTSSSCNLSTQKANRVRILLTPKYRLLELERRTLHTIYYRMRKVGSRLPFSLNLQLTLALTEQSDQLSQANLSIHDAALEDVRLTLHMKLVLSDRYLIPYTAIRCSESMALCSRLWPGCTI